jgi:hypothetical protein
MHLMRSFRTHGLSVLAMLLLILGTAAPALARMTCVMGGPSILSLGQAEDCAPVDHEHPVTTVSATCCEVLQTQPQRTAFMQGTGAFVPVLFGAALPPVPPLALTATPFVWRDAQTFGPPPLMQSRRLAAFRTFLI